METASPKTRVPRSFSGVVTANAMTKTIVVRVDRILVHPKYGKRYRVSKKYHVHAEQGIFPVGTKVQFVECRPYSKTVRWRVLTPAK